MHIHKMLSSVSLLLLCAMVVVSARRRVDAQDALELSRTARPWEFLSATGQSAGLFGNEAGNFEAWVYPLKILRDFHVRFLTEGRSVPAETLVRTVTARPESVSILYAGDTFSVNETWFVPIHDPGAVVLFQVQTEHPLEIEAAFTRDFQLEWPAGLGGTYVNWDPVLHAFRFGEEQRKYFGLVGSPTGTVTEQEYQTNYSGSSENALRLGATLKGTETKIVVISGSVTGRAAAESVYKNLIADYVSKKNEAAAYYRDYLARTVSLKLPDPQIQQAYDWARVSVIQGLVTNPFLGTGLVAGYRSSGTGQRPGFAWYFGRDSFWTELALDAEGDFATTRTALNFIAKYQRADGKIPHEVSQGANFVPWFTDFPYAYASADATPLYIIAVDDYVSSSSDVAYARDNWDHLWRALQFIRSTYDSNGLPQNFGFGHGWVEGGPLLPVKTEFYQAGVVTKSLSALSHLAHLVGKEDVSAQLSQEFDAKKKTLDEDFWSAESNTYAFALDVNNKQIVEPSVLATVPFWFGLADPQKANLMLNQLAAPEHQTDWGMRIIASNSKRYDGGGYHYGSVWPLFTGWASVGNYRYHHSLAGYSSLRTNALLALGGSLGHVTEVLSGDYYQPLSTSSPHQIWSSAMVISPLLRGLLGLSFDATAKRLVFAPHIPANWTSLEIRKVRIGAGTVNLDFSKTNTEISLNANADADCELEFSPALSVRAQIISTEVNGHRVAAHIDRNELDQHVTAHMPLVSGMNQIRIRFRDDFELIYANSLPLLGSRSRDLRIMSESWSPSHDALTLEVAGTPGSSYELQVSSVAQIASVDGAEEEGGQLVIRIPTAGEYNYARKKVVIHFSGKTAGHSAKAVKK